MGLITCNKLLSVGVQQFDDEHCQLVTITNQLHDAIKSGTGVQAVQLTLQQLAGFAAAHFRSEEELLERHAYPELEQHRQAHQAILDRLGQLQSSSDHVQGSAIMQFLLDWLVIHTKEVDKKYGPFLNSQGVY